ncbi:MAG TPA: oligosaccharide flippase family protein [Candidatus Angelobacter sp.]|nr:oligosaccharide flippase family protein [Candidatus Angelobacter sp.]
MLDLEQKKTPLSGKMIRNVAFGGLRAVLVAPVPFILTPLILRTIGSRGYGTWAVFVAMNSLTSLADLGLLGTLSKYVAEYNAQGDFARLNRLLNTGVAVFGLLASLMAGTLWVLSSRVVQLLFRGSAQSPVELLWLFRCSLILLWINIVTFSSASVTSGMQRLDLTNMLAAFNVVCAAILGGTFLLMGWGVRGLLYGSILSAGITLACYSWLIKKLVPEFKLNPFYADRIEAQKIFSFSWRVYLVQAAGAIQNHLEKVLLALFVGVIPVGWYDIASDTASKIRGVPALLLSPILPAASELDAQDRRSKLEELYFRSHKYLAFCAVPLVFYGVVISKRFVDLWVGPGLDAVAIPLSALLIVNLINLTTGPGLMILMGQGQLWQGVYAAMTGIGVGTPLSILLIYRYGFHGAVVGAALSSFISSVLFFYFYHRTTHESAIRLLKEAYSGPILCAAGLLILEFLIRPASDLSWYGMITQALIFAVLYLLILLPLKFFDSYDWDRVQMVLPVMRYARKITRDV